MNQPLETAVQAALDSRVRPLLHSHNGDIEIRGIDPAGTVLLRLLGACASCMGAQQTIRDIVVAAIRESCPSVTEVRVETGVSDELAAEALRFLRDRKRR